MTDYPDMSIYNTPEIERAQDRLHAADHAYILAINANGYGHPLNAIASRAAGKADEKVQKLMRRAEAEAGIDNSQERFDREDAAMMADPGWHSQF